MRVILTLCCAFLILSCNSNKNGNKTYLPSSNGQLNTISAVVDNLLWEDAVGETIRGIFAAPIEGLPVDEPKFTVKQIPPQVFDGFTTKSRIILKIEKGDVDAKTKIARDVFAKPQTVVVVQGRTNTEIIAQLKADKNKIIDAFNKEEVKERQRKIKLSLLPDQAIEKKLGLNINIPSVYKTQIAEDNFFWIRKSISEFKTMDLMLYEVPTEAISKGDSTIVDIIDIRNKITKTKIPGEDDIYMSVQDAYVPSMYKTIIDNKEAYEVRGLWKMNGYTMAGPFITYVIEDKINKRYLIADGYVYAPSLAKRDYIFELESIIKSIKIK